jgi:hypothetical protein
VVAQEPIRFRVLFGRSQLALQLFNALSRPDVNVERAQHTAPYQAHSAHKVAAVAGDAGWPPILVDASRFY